MLTVKNVKIIKVENPKFQVRKCLLFHWLTCLNISKPLTSGTSRKARILKVDPAVINSIST
jgi:hypothetical protein